MTSNVCVVIPAYNASRTIRNIVIGALKHVSKVIVADDGSTDNTAVAASGAGAEIIIIDRNRGKGNALRVLFQKTINEEYDAVISMDADEQHDPEEIPKFLAAHIMHPDDIISGSRMGEKEKIPRARYNSMCIAQYYISLAANQFLEDTQCGFRLYPLSIIKKIRLKTERFVTETELLMKAGDMGVEIRFVNIKTIYNENGTYFKPVKDIIAITAYVISYIYIKWFIEGITSNNSNTYLAQNHVRDLIGKNKIMDILFQIFAVFTALPATVFFLIEYLFLWPFIPNNFASIRKRGCKFSRITLSTHALPVLLIIAGIEKIMKVARLNVNTLDGVIKKIFTNSWKNTK
ncbi:MAG: glycosyltransferase family 2 protein [Candidatus Brocadia sp.]|nr:glycosyltransferase family 2 protein [Candidatus Brocadia sp.]